MRRALLALSAATLLLPATVVQADPAEPPPQATLPVVSMRAAPMMPASLRSSAATIGARRSSSGNGDSTEEVTVKNLAPGRYYVAIDAIHQGYSECAVRAVPAAEVEEAVIAQVRHLLQTPEIIARICAMKPEPRWVPGEKAGYHQASSWFVLGEVIRRLEELPKVGSVTRQ